MVNNAYHKLELEITVGHFLTIFRDLAEQFQFARTNLLHILMGKPITVYKMLLMLLNGLLILI